MPFGLSDQWVNDYSMPVAIIGGMIIFLLLMLVFLSSVCLSALEESSLSGLKSIDAAENRKTKRLTGIKTNSEKYAVRLKTVIVFFSVLSSGLTLMICSVPLASAFYHILKSAFWSMICSCLLLMLIMSILIGIVSGKLSHRAAQSSPDRLLYRFCGFIIFIYYMILPLSAIIKGVSCLLFRLFVHGDKSRESSVENPTEEKILMMVDEGEENGTIEENTKSMIENVFEFDDTTVGEIMTHRKDIIAVKDDDSLTTLKEKAIMSGRSRIPVYHDDIDTIIGVIYVKDLLQFVGTERNTDYIDKSIIHEAVYVPESKRCSEMFEYMTTHKTQIAVVVDEFGGTGGIITMEDLIESILGSIQDEYDNEDDGIRKVNDFSFQVDGATSLDEIEELTGITFEENENDTIAGIMLDRMGHIPKSGEHPSIMINGTRFTVMEVDGRRISRILIVKQHHQVGLKEQGIKKGKR